MNGQSPQVVLLSINFPHTSQKCGDFEALVNLDASCDEQATGEGSATGVYASAIRAARSAALNASNTSSKSPSITRSRLYNVILIR